MDKWMMKSWEITVKWTHKNLLYQIKIHKPFSWWHQHVNHVILYINIFSVWITGFFPCKVLHPAMKLSHKLKIQASLWRCESRGRDIYMTRLPFSACYVLADSHASIQSLYTSMGSDKSVCGQEKLHWRMDQSINQWINQYMPT